MVLTRTQGYSRKHAPDGATAGTAVVGASFGERVAAQTRAQRLDRTTTADVSARTVPLRWSQSVESIRAVPCTALGMRSTTHKMHSHTHVHNFWEYSLSTQSTLVCAIRPTSHAHAHKYAHTYAPSTCIP